MKAQDRDPISTGEELAALYDKLEKKCQKIQDFEDPGMTCEEMIEEFIAAQKYIAMNGIFSANQSVKEILTENLKYLTLPYHVGFLFGRITTPRKQAVKQSRNYLQAFLNLVTNFNSEDEQLFPENIKRTWQNMQQKKQFNLPREEVIANHKQKKAIETRYTNSIKVREQSDQRQIAKDFIKLKIYEAVTQIKNIEEEMKILEYKEQIEKDPETKAKHEEELQKPIPKIKYWEIKKPEQIQQDLVPPPQSLQQKKVELVAQVWQQNANKPTMTLSEVAELERQNMFDRMAREKKQKEENQVDTDSDKEEVDDRDKKKARAWDDWKDDNEKGAGNRANKR